MNRHRSSLSYAHTFLRTTHWIFLLITISLYRDTRATLSVDNIKTLRSIDRRQDSQDTITLNRLARWRRWRNRRWGERIPWDSRGRRHVQANTYIG